MIIFLILLIGFAAGVCLPYGLTWEYYGKDPEMIKRPWMRLGCTLITGTGILLFIYFVLFELVK